MANDLDPTDFRNALACFASGVTVVTTHDPDGKPAGFTASAFSSLSLNPPLVLVCLERRADCFAAFEAASSMGISILATGQDGIAMTFATKGVDKFANTKTERGTVTGLPLIAGALAQMECAMHAKLDGGDHVILVGEVLRAASGNSEPLLHYSRNFGRFQAG